MKPVAIVTGANRGIGAAAAKLLAQKGYAVCVNYNSAKDKAEKIVADIQAAGGEAIAVKADISSQNDIKAMFETVDNQLGPVTALINNAGTNGGISSVENITSDTLNSVFATNVFGTFYCCQEAIKRMKQNGGGKIVNISSEAARFGGTQLAHYAASKAAINTFTIAFAREAAPHQVTVNAISPGVIDTEIHANSPAERINKLLDSLPMKRMGTVEEVAQLILWLVSDAAAYVSGSIIPITGSR